MTEQRKVIEILLSISQELERNKDFLTELDNVIGDGDHGINMARGFKEIEKKIDTLKDKNIGEVLKSIGMILVSSVGGSAGPLYGTAFMRAGMVIGDKTQIGISDFLDALEAGIEGVKTRGKSTTGEKTMLDSMVPSLNAMREKMKMGAGVKEILLSGSSAADEGVQNTIPMLATKGRASYLGERSIGHQDPGATSFAIMIKEIAKAY